MRGFSLSDSWKILVGDCVEHLAKMEDFRFFGIEREEEYVDIAKARLKEASKQPSLF